MKQRTHFKDMVANKNRSQFSWLRDTSSGWVQLTLTVLTPDTIAYLLLCYPGQVLSVIENESPSQKTYVRDMIANKNRSQTSALLTHRLL